ncbi:PREDICTED: progestin and adipoQ receptor family member 3 isoform X2 [Nicrophorus vespilloides]|uniref:Progestin and adipoQ receptor family member 3 isoform X2 n=1 Tax=Nicrophorus vespilloides TaxID=110193 RepID=A0ABM1M041_NICVS|nr:PREDICTED: progestin and adipoQ receptor family member 3 isoform X2 [Nicrophorus vespilloides]
MTVCLHHEIPKSECRSEKQNETCCTDDVEEEFVDRTQTVHDEEEYDKCGKSAEEKKKKSRSKSYESEEKMKRLLTFDEAPSYLAHNRFILSGYRGILNTKLCIESIFWWTNETINIWSHIFGFVLFTALTFYDFLALNIHGHMSDKFLVASVLFCFVACMFLSSMYHTFNCRSEEDFHGFLNLDLFGIALSLLAIYTSGIYFAFWCHSHWRQFYIISVTLIFFVAMLLQHPKFNVDSNTRMIVFVSWAAYGVIPTIHWIFVMGGINNPVVELLLPRVLGMYAISGTAFFIYITKIPERFCAGKFDYLGHSHQWWHIIIVLALYYWHSSGIIYVNYRINHACADSMRLD